MTTRTPAPALVCFGEIMLRLSAPGDQRFEDVQQLDVHFGGAEANVAVELASLGGSASFVSRLPVNRLANMALERLGARGVGTAQVLRGGARLGTFFLERGAGFRPGAVIYDRAHSAITELQPGMIDWPQVLAGAQWFHWSGITPALSPGCAAVCREACEAARRMGLKVSFDLNYRSALWSLDTAASVLQPLMSLVHHCVCGVSEARDILGATESGADPMETVAQSLCEKYGFQSVAMTSRRGESASHNHFRGMFYIGGQPHHSREHELEMVDRVGTGDAFTGALLHAIMAGRSPADAVEFATAASAWKHTIPGDWNRASLQEIEALAAGAKGARLRR